MSDVIDLQDLQSLLGRATRDHSKQILSAAIEALQLKIASTPSPVSVKEEEVKFTEFQFTSITDYGWENKDKSTIKVYLLKGLEGIKSLDKNNI